MRKIWEQVQALGIFFVLVAMAFGGLYLLVGGQSRTQTKLIAWNVYKGTAPNYRILIDESQYEGKSMERIVHLEPENGYDEPHPHPFAITGHDLDADGVWERIFIQRTSKDGCNAVSRGSFSQEFTVFDPCNADKDTFEPFTDHEINHALTHLDAAMATIYNTDHRQHTLEDWNMRYQQSGG